MDQKNNELLDGTWFPQKITTLMNNHVLHPLQKSINFLPKPSQQNVLRQLEQAILNEVIELPQANQLRLQSDLDCLAKSDIKIMVENFGNVRNMSWEGQYFVGYTCEEYMWVVRKNDDESDKVLHLLVFDSLESFFKAFLEDRFPDHKQYIENGYLAIQSTIKHDKTYLEYLKTVDLAKDHQVDWIKSTNTKNFCNPVSFMNGYLKCLEDQRK